MKMSAALAVLLTISVVFAADTSCSSEAPAQGARLLQSRESLERLGAKTRDPLVSGVFVAYLSAVHNQDRRANVRNKCLADLKRHNISYRFFVGRPHFPDGTHHKSQGSVSTKEERAHAQMLRAEQSQYGDLHIVPVPDQYKDLSDKVSGMFDYFLNTDYDLMLKIDDDMCPNVSALRPLLEMSQEHVALYSGVFNFSGEEYQSQMGPDGTRSNYFAGECYAASRSLANVIFRENDFDTQLFQEYGNDSEDTNMGKWYERAKRTSGSSFRKTKSDICVPVDNILDNVPALVELTDAPQRKLFYLWPQGGVNSVRLMFESMIALALVSGRELVLPSPVPIAHLANNFSESDIWDLHSLSIRWSMGNHTFESRPSDVYVLEDGLPSLVPSSLPADQDWFIPGQLTHFECLKFNAEQRHAAAQELLKLRFRQDFIYLAELGLDRLGLQRGGFDSIHLRRGDFKGHAPDVLLDGCEIATALNRHAEEEKRPKRPLLIATDYGMDDGSVQALKRCSTASQVLWTGDAFQSSGLTARASIGVDMLMMAAGATFTGTPVSTFTAGIAQERSKNSVREGRLPPPVFYYMNFNISQGLAGFAKDRCLFKETTFSALLGSEYIESSGKRHASSFCEKPDCDALAASPRKVKGESLQQPVPVLVVQVVNNTSSDVSTETHAQQARHRRSILPQKDATLSQVAEAKLIASKYKDEYLRSVTKRFGISSQGTSDEMSLRLVMSLTVEERKAAFT